jgi:hypothetical protein
VHCQVPLWHRLMPVLQYLLLLLLVAMAVLLLLLLDTA